MTNGKQQARASGAGPVHVTDLPEVVQNAIVFHELLLRAGFQPEAIRFDVTPASALGLAHDANLVMGVLREGRRELLYALGRAEPQVDELIEHALIQWDTADGSARSSLWEKSRLTKYEHLWPLLKQIISHGFTIPNLDPRQLAAASPPRAAGGPVLAPAGAPRFELGKVVVDDDEQQQLAGTDFAPYLARHACGDWGDAEFPRENEAALRDGLPIVSVFRTPDDVAFWITTAAARTHTTVRPGYRQSDLGPIPRHLICRYLGTGTREQIAAMCSANSELVALPLVLRDGPTVGGLIEEVAAVLGRAITADALARRRTANPEQMVRTLWSSVHRVDLRPIDGAGRRLSGLPRDGQHRAWKRAKADCGARGIRAWFLVSYEARLNLE